MRYSFKRKTFGKRLIEHPVIRLKLAQMARQVEGTHTHTASYTCTHGHALSNSVCSTCMKMSAIVMLQMCVCVWYAASQAWLESVTYQMTTMTHEEQNKRLAGPIALLKAQSTITYTLCTHTHTNSF